MLTVTSKDGTAIAYERAGDGPPLVLVDPAGWCRGIGPMTEPASLLPRHFTTYGYDRRGRGESGDTLPYAVDREVEDLAAVIEAAGGSAAVYGFSSGAVLALHAAAAGLPITELVLLEPPVPAAEEPTDDEFGRRIAELIDQGRRGDAMIRFHTGIGVPPELVEQLRAAPYWPKLEALAHTLCYDVEITTRRPPLAGITTPTLVIDSTGSDDRLRAWARGVADELPNGTHRSLPGEWHGVPAEDLVATITEYVTGR